MTTTLTAFQQQRRDTASNWTSNNPTLLAGEWGIETDTKKFKLGDGSSNWQSLEYVPIPDTNRLLAGDLTIGGSLTVNGTTTEISTQNLNVEDKNIIIGKVSSPSDTTADGGGITLKAGSDVTITWSDANNSWDFNQNINAASTYGYEINNVSVLNATTLGSSVVNSSLTSVGTIGTGVWQGTAIGSSYMTAGTTSAVGAVQLTDSVTSTSTTTAATPNSVKTAKDAADSAQTTANTANTTANAALPKSGGQITGNITCSGTQTFDGRDLSVDGAKLDGISAGATGNQTKADIDALGVNAATFTVADESTDTSCSVLFSTGATGEQAAKSGSNFTFNSNDGNVTATKFTGNLTGNVTGDVTGDVTGNVTGSSGSCTGNSATATALATARTISGASFDGTADITLNNSNITNGAGYITATLTNEQVQDIVGLMLSSNTETGITVTYDDSDGTIDFVVATQSDNNFTNALLAVLNGLSSSVGELSNGVTATTQSAGDASTKVATTAYTDTAISNLVDSSPSALNTLNELATALGDDANFSTTVTNSIATKLALAGGTLTGNLNLSSSYIDFSGSISTPSTAAAIYRPADNSLAISTANNERLLVNNSGATITGNVACDGIRMTDNDEIRLGTSDDLKIYHDGNDSYFTSLVTGAVYHRARTSWYLGTNATSGGSDNAIHALQNGAVELYWDGSKKFETTSSGVTVTGQIDASGAIKGNSSNSGKWVRMYGSAGTGRWDIYGHGANLRFSDNDTAGSVVFDQNVDANGGLDVTGTCTATTFSGSGASLTNIPAANITGTLPALDGSNLTGLTVNNAQTLDNLDSTQFLRSDTTSTTSSALNFSAAGEDLLNFTANSTSDNRGISFNDRVALSADYNDNYLRLNNASEFGNGVYTPLVMRADGGFKVGSGGTVWHSNNDGSGSGLDADTVDGIQASSFLRSDSSTTFNANGNDFDFNSDGNRTLINFNYNSSVIWKLLQNSSGQNLNFDRISGSGQFQVDGYRVLTTADEGSGNGLDADTVDSLHASSFLRSDADDTTSGEITISRSGNQKLVLSGSNEPYIRFQEGTTNKAYLQWHSNGSFYIVNQESGEQLLIGSGNDGLKYQVDGSNKTVYHSGNIPTYMGKTGNYWNANNWIQLSSTHGLYWPNNHSYHVYLNNQYLHIRNNSTSNGLYMSTDNGTLRGYLYVNSSNNIGLLNNSGSWILQCDSSGNATFTGNVTAYSDARLKTNVNTIDNALDIVDQLRGVSFDWIESGKHSIGVIAQEVEKVLPELVVTQEISTTEHPEEKEVKSVDYGKMVGVLINAIKELKAEVDELKGGK